jgi:hypothetical protein
MDEPVLDYVQRLERKVRFWRNTSLILAAFLISGLVATWTLARVQQGFVLRAMAQAEVARAEALRAEAAKMQAERAMQEAKERKD